MRITSPARRTLPRRRLEAFAGGAVLRRPGDAAANAWGYTTSIAPKRESARATSSTNPSASTSCEGSPDRFSNGARAMLAAMADIEALTANTPILPGQNSIQDVSGLASLRPRTVQKRSRPVRRAERVPLLAARPRLLPAEAVPIPSTRSCPPAAALFALTVSPSSLKSVCSRLPNRNLLWWHIPVTERGADRVHPGFVRCEGCRKRDLAMVRQLLPGVRRRFVGDRP